MLCRHLIFEELSIRQRLFVACRLNPSQLEVANEHKHKNWIHLHTQSDHETRTVPYPVSTSAPGSDRDQVPRPIHVPYTYTGSRTLNHLTRSRHQPARSICHR